MYSPSEKLLIATKWVASFLSARWTIRDYPIRLRRNGENPPQGQEWVAQIMRWWIAGTGGTKEEAIANLAKNLESVREHRFSRRQDMPRPGSNVPQEFADATCVTRDSALLDDFLQRILGFAPDAPVFVSDESSLHDFGDESYVAQQRLKVLEVYGVDVSDLKDAKLCDVFDRIRTKG